MRMFVFGGCGRLASGLCLACVAIWLLGCGMTGNPDQIEAQGVRAPAVAGQFYPADAGRLEAALTGSLEAARPPGAGRVSAIIVPHAGYVFSGQIAADAFRQAAGGGYRLVVLLGTNHTVPGFRGMALAPWRAFRTPLGEVAVDEAAARALAEAAPADFRANAQAHAREHSIEVQLPFVQRLFPEAKILPLVVGESDPERCTRYGEALANAIRERSALIVASSDLSHYPSYVDAVEVDRAVLRAIETFDPARVHAVIEEQMDRGVRELATCACGEGAILVALAASKALGATRARMVSYANSGDTLLGERRRVVGYGAVCIETGPPPAGSEEERPATGAGDAGLEEEDRRALVAFARRVLESYLASDTVPLPRDLPERTRQRRGAFVTLTKEGDLRGCIGHIVADAPLGWVVGAMAIQAATGDPRFPPLDAAELADVEIEISALTVPRPVAGPDEIVVGRDGVILTKSGRSAVFLPQVATEQGWDRATMLDHLCRKAGLGAGEWRKGAEFLVFQADVFGEHQSTRR